LDDSNQGFYIHTRQPDDSLSFHLLDPFSNYFFK